MRPDCQSFVPGYGDANADFHLVGDHPGVHGGIESGVPFTEKSWSTTFLSALSDGGLIAGFARDVSSVASATPGTDATEAEAADGGSAEAEAANRGSAEAEAADGGSAEAEAADGGSAEAEAVDGGSAETEAADADATDPIRTDRTYFSYLHMCVPDGTPTEESYADMERFFDAELRAIAAHVLLPVGARATEHVLEQYTARAWKTDVDMDALHGEEILGSGWLVLPIKDPAEWDADDADHLVASLRTLRSTDYRRESDLGRFVAGSDPYLVR
ncbi:uracil-DNA glycosylase [Halorubrum trueperi]|uniref:Uracil-DNA glycosylase n=1 Tax=Halorubrum trueperi TaxID=2004704 RepID=A0ABD5UHA9_9EURY